MLVRRTLVASLLLACALPLAASPASADPVPLPTWLYVPEPGPGIGLPVEGELFRLLEDELEALRPLVEVPGPGPGPGLRVATVTFECRVDEAGQTECRGVVCSGSGGQGTLPVGRGDEEYEVGVDATPNADGSYGPYDTVRVSLSQNCGCTAWVQAPWSLVD